MKLKILATTRTNNFTDPEIINKITGLWTQNSERIQATFKNGQAVFAVYHDYLSDYHGDYSVSLCIPAEEHYDFETSTANWLEYPVDATSEDGVLTSWKKIWSDEDHQLIKRRYLFDYEQYNPDGSIAIKLSLADE